MLEVSGITNFGIFTFPMCGQIWLHTPHPTGQDPPLDRARPPTRRRSK